jgi:hypothetical protein
MKLSVFILFICCCMKVSSGFAFDASQLPPELREELFKRVVDYYRSKPASEEASAPKAPDHTPETEVSLQPAVPQTDPVELERMLQEQRRIEEERRKRVEHDGKVRDLLKALGYDADSLIKEPAPAQESDTAGNR